MKHGPLDGKIALVTGGARGIGRNIVLRLAKAGAAVAVGCQTQGEAAAATVAQVESLGGRAAVAAGDLGDPDAVDRLVDSVEQRLGPISILVHNAAPPRKGAALIDDHWGQFDLHYRVAVQAAWILARRLAPQMIASQFGRMIFITTTSTNLYVPGFGAYCAAKSALETFARYLAVELGTGGVTVNVVAPGLTQKDESPPLTVDPTKLPLTRIAQANDVAEAVAMFADPAAASLTGTILPVDGGLRLLEPMRGRVGGQGQ